MFKVGDKLRYKRKFLKEWGVNEPGHWYKTICIVTRCDGRMVDFSYNGNHGVGSNIMHFELIEPAGPLTEIDILDNIQRNIQEDL